MNRINLCVDKFYKLTDEELHRLKNEVIIGKNRNTDQENYSTSMILEGYEENTGIERERSQSIGILSEEEIRDLITQAGFNGQFAIQEEITKIKQRILEGTSLEN